jgi:hypothetical protein
MLKPFIELNETSKKKFISIFIFLMNSSTLENVFKEVKNQIEEENIDLSE